VTAAGFKIKRIKSELAIGDSLKRARIRRKISVADVEEATHIRAKFILALESDSWEQIPSEVYGRGYLERYLQFLQMPVDEYMARYDRERSSYARHCQDAKVELSPPIRYTVPRFLLTTRFFVMLLIGLVFLGSMGVLGMQIAKFSAAPSLKLITPAQAKSLSDGELVVQTNSVNISGRTDIGATVQIDDQSVEVDNNGNFAGVVNVQKGSNAVIIRATNTKGKVTSETLNIVVQ
jgi:cytoskeletal protein RodZ